MTCPRQPLIKAKAIWTRHDVVKKPPRQPSGDDPDALAIIAVAAVEVWGEHREERFSGDL